MGRSWHRNGSYRKVTGAVQAMNGISGPNVSAGPGGAYSHIVTTPAVANCILTFTNTGLIQITTSSTTTIGQWITPASLANGNYEVRWDIVAGAVSGGTTGVWQALSSSHSVSRNRSGVGSNNVTLDVSVRRNGVTLSTKQYTLTGQVDI